MINQSHLNILNKHKSCPRTKAIFLPGKNPCQSSTLSLTFDIYTLFLRHNLR